ncbi:MAG: putative rane protein, partial [Phycisphaerales bacterium]|nr:putative rane protein [Phycisphaerales bacterium]
IVQSEQLRIDADVQRLGDSPLWLFITDDDAHWSRYTMDEAGGGRFGFTLNAVERDLRYYVTGGDAATRRFTVRVKRPPAVAQFRVRYTYPAYSARQPLSVVNTDGLIEAPTGSEALLTIVSTEPLQSALLTVGGDKVLMERTSLENVRQARLQIRRDAAYELDLISTREVHGNGPAKMQIRATPDRPPLVRLPQAGQSLRLNPRDILPLSYQALDDYGLDSLAVHAQINGADAQALSLRLAGDRRKQEDTFNFDLASLSLSIGDVLTLNIVARDSAGQETESDSLHVLIAPRSIDLGTHERIDELTAAARFSAALADELEAAGKSIDEAEGKGDKRSSAYLASAGRANRHLTSASEAATLLRQSLLRTLAHSGSPEMSVALAGWADAAQSHAQLADDLFRQGGSATGMGPAPREKLRHSVEQARELFTQLRTVAQGERAAAVLADRENLEASKGKPPPADPRAADRLTKTLQRARDDINAGATDVGVNAGAPDADQQLRSRSEAAAGVVRSRQPIHFAQAAREWSTEMQRDPNQKLGFDARLSAAAQAEAVRPDADLVRAADLDLAGRAAGAVEAFAANSPHDKLAATHRLEEFAGAMGALQHVHSLTRQGVQGKNPDELRTAHAAAVKARENMNRWIADPAGRPKSSGPALATRQGELEALALGAGADAAARDYQRAAQADDALTRKLTDAARNPARKSGRTGDTDAAGAVRIEERVDRIERAHQQVVRTMAAAQKVDTLGQTQDKLTEETRAAKGKQPAELVGRQRTVAEAIAQVERQEAAAGFNAANSPSRDEDDPNWRGRATAALLIAQEQLAAMPQELASAEAAASARHEAADRAARARQEANAAPADRKPVAGRAADQAEMDAKAATDRLAKAIEPVAPQVAAELAGRLDPFAPEASAARDVVAKQLSAALTALAAAAMGNDLGAVSRATAEARAAMELAQKELARAQESFTERDPLMAAKWFARAAADSLAHGTPDVRTALAHQSNASVALSRAWDRSIHHAAALRLSVLPSLQSVYAPAPSPADRDTASLSPLAPAFAAVRDWGKLRPREGDDLSAPLHEADPPGYEEPLRLYFEAIGKAQEKK